MSSLAISVSYMEKFQLHFFFVPILANPVLRIFEYKNSLESLGMDSLLHM